MGRPFSPDQLDTIAQMRGDNTHNVRPSRAKLAAARLGMPILLPQFVCMDTRVGEDGCPVFHLIDKRPVVHYPSGFHGLGRAGMIATLVYDPSALPSSIRDTNVTARMANGLKGRAQPGAHPTDDDCTDVRKARTTAEFIANSSDDLREEAGDLLQRTVPNDSFRRTTDMYGHALDNGMIVDDGVAVDEEIKGAVPTAKLQGEPIPGVGILISMWSDRTLAHEHPEAGNPAYVIDHAASLDLGARALQRTISPAVSREGLELPMALHEIALAHVLELHYQTIS